MKYRADAGAGTSTESDATVCCFCFLPFCLAEATFAAAKVNTSASKIVARHGRWNTDMARRPCCWVVGQHSVDRKIARVGGVLRHARFQSVQGDTDNFMQVTDVVVCSGN